MTIDGTDALVGASLGQLRGDHLLRSEDDALVAADADRCAAVLYRLDGVLDLKVATIWREDGVEQVVARAYRSLGSAALLALVRCNAATRRRGQQLGRIAGAHHFCVA